MFSTRARWRRRPAASAAALAALALFFPLSASAGAGRPPTPPPTFTPTPGMAPAAVADAFPVAYAPRPVLRSARVDAAAGTVTLPLHQGRQGDGTTVWYVLTDASDRDTAERLGLDWSPKLANAPAAAVRPARFDRDGSLVFERGAVDFAPERVLVPGPADDPFPPAEARPGSVGDADYSPLVQVGEGGRRMVLNATVVAAGPAPGLRRPDGEVDHRRVIDRATAVAPAEGTITLATSVAAAAGHPALFVSLDSNSELVSALEATTYAPRLAGLPVGRGNAPDSAVSTNYIVENGARGAGNPQRQGLDGALGDPGAPVLDVFATVPGVVAGDAYSPMWDLHVGQWTPAAVAAGHRSALHGELEALGMARRGLLTALGGGPLGPSGLVSNCPVLVTY